MNDIVKKENTLPVSTPTPMDMIQLAVQQGASPEQLGQLMDLQDRFEQKEAKRSFVLALAKFRKECPDINKDAKAHTSKYATLSNTLDTIKTTMEDCGLTHSWRTETEGKEEKKEVTVICIVTHTDGHSEQSSLTAGLDLGAGRNTIQAMGSTVSYLQRYTLFAVLGITAREMDDDGYGPKQVISSAQKEEILKLIEDTETNLKLFLKHMEVKSIDEIPLIKLNKAMDGLNRKGKK